MTAQASAPPDHRELAQEALAFMPGRNARLF